MFKTKTIVSQIRTLLPKNLSSKLPRKIGVVLLNIRESARLNLIYRNKSRPTNVLSFYYNPEYGEILICPEIVKKEAKEQGNTQPFQMTWMIVHGMLHLADLHHELSGMYLARFERIEKKILKNLG